MSRAASESELRKALTDVTHFLAFGSVFLVLGFLTPSITRHYQALCWQTATVGFFAAAVVVWRHPVVWYPVVRRWINQLKKKPKSPYH
ncbi:hypothetical protein GQ55_2G346500 [Panicum hallii var. hallii]|uniref:Uncharacterized protein n=3 Tax=Panicum sect. Panicum TaxID=2100772 RepID=A0A3L6QWI5_PANMI|nr:hypothetical protein PAHAL_2G357300 [Panicum hallii]PUZ71838.1 hypothetical protein GQ55_2G346500 [Panicum hallii var. hallii]RLM87135.1 hypothetical protein C2845_PM04G23380 [Panicum miliaceum]